MKLGSDGLQINSAGDWAKCIWVNCSTQYACAYHVYYNEDKFYVTAEGLCCAHNGFYTYSDLNQKENVINITNATDKVKQLRGVSFNFKPDVLNAGDSVNVLPTDPPKTQIGFIAQEIEQIVPEVVTTLHDGTKAVAYQNVVALLVEAIKELNLKVEELQFDLNTCCNIESDIKNKSLDQNGFNNIDSTGKGSSILFQNTPNPFKESTTISYYIDNNSFDASIFVFDMQGTLLKSYDILKKGKGSIIISGGEMNAGMYMYSLIVNGKEIDTKRMILTK
ncbi:MAG TPA: tail fiber domain-containing protein [Bacteroidales bacterium]|nr:tail fiber domain-containing protein [Bacteroidales bacterium]